MQGIRKEKGKTFLNQRRERLQEVIQIVVSQNEGCTVGFIAAKMGLKYGVSQKTVEEYVNTLVDGNFIKNIEGKIFAVN